MGPVFQLFRTLPPSRRPNRARAKGETNLHFLGWNDEEANRAFARRSDLREKFVSARRRPTTRRSISFFRGDLELFREMTARHPFASVRLSVLGNIQYACKGWKAARLVRVTLKFPRARARESPVARENPDGTKTASGHSVRPRVAGMAERTPKRPHHIEAGTDEGAVAPAKRRPQVYRTVRSISPFPGRIETRPCRYGRFC